MGTPDFAVPVLTEIAAHGHDIAAVYTRAPKPAGRRGLETLPSPVAVAAAKLGLAVYTPVSLRTAEAASLFACHKADVAVVVAYGLHLAESHPRCAGEGMPQSARLASAPLARRRADPAGDHGWRQGKRASRSCAWMRRSIPGLSRSPNASPIGPEMTAGELHDELSLLGAALMARALDLLARDALTFALQSETGIIYAEKISKAEALIDWSRDADEVHNLVRGLSPFPGAAFLANFGKGAERIKVLRSRIIEAQGPPGTILDDELTIACGRDALRLLEVQRAAKRRRWRPTFCAARD